eukprot:4379084-Prymnesium_polylepis.1
MRVLGAARPFSYGAKAGAGGTFQAALHHASVPPISDREHLKVAFFYRIAADVRPTAAVSRAATAATAAATTAATFPVSHTTATSISSPTAAIP